jgi:hypothetical protein
MLYSWNWFPLVKISKGLLGDDCCVMAKVLEITPHARTILCFTNGFFVLLLCIETQRDTLLLLLLVGGKALRLDIHPFSVRFGCDGGCFICLSAAKYACLSRVSNSFAVFHFLARHYVPGYQPANINFRVGWLFFPLLVLWFGSPAIY